MRRVVGIPLVPVQAMENLIITVILIQLSIAVPRASSAASKGRLSWKKQSLLESTLSPSGSCDTVAQKPLTDAVLALMSTSAERHVENCYFRPIKH